jgi:hypothetical protein
LGPSKNYVRFFFEIPEPTEGFLLLYLGYLRLIFGIKFGTQVKGTKIGPRIFFWARKVSGGFRNEAPEEKLCLWIVSEWKDIQS